MAEIKETDSPTVTSPEVLDAEAKKPVTNSLLDVLGGSRPKTSSTIVTPPAQPQRRSSRPQYISPEEEIERKRKLKAKKAEDYETFITETFNDYIITALIGAGVPESILYKPGKAPKRQAVDSAYTDLAASLILKPQQAKAIATFLAELSNTEKGAALSQSYNEGATGLILKGLGATIAGGTYLVGVNQTMKKLMPLLKALKQSKVVENDEATTDMDQP